MPQRSVATNFTFEQQRTEINLLAADFWSHKTAVDTAATSYLKHNGSNDFTGGTLNVPAAFTISSNSGNGTVTIAGNLQVDGTTTTVNTATMDVVDKNITIAKGSANDAAADGAGITIDSATDITLNFVDANDAWVSSIGLEATTFLKGPYGQFTGSGTPTTGQGVEVNAPDANTGQIISYDRGNTAYKDLRIKGSSVGVYTGTTNALEATFSSTGLAVAGNIQGGGSAGVTGAWGQTDWNLEVYNSGGDAYGLIAGTSGAAIELKDTVTGEAFVIAANGDCNLYSYKNGDSMSFHTTDGNGTGKRLRIGSTGDVTLGYAGNSLYFENGFNDSNARIQNAGATNNSNLRFLTRSSGTEAERFRIESDGKIYVGGSGAAATAGELWFNDTSAYSSIIKQVSGSSALSFHTGQSQPERLRIASDGTISKYHNATDIAAAFGGGGQVNGVTALPSMAGVPFVVAKDTGSLRSATFAGLVETGALIVKGDNSATSRFQVQTTNSSPDLRLHTWNDANGMYALLGVNDYLNASGNNTSATADKKSAGIFIDGRSGKIELRTKHDSGTSPSARLSITSSGYVTITDTPTLLIKNTSTQGNGVGGITIGKDYAGTDGCIQINSVATGSDTDHLGIQFKVHPSGSGSAQPEETMRLRHDGTVTLGSSAHDISQVGGEEISGQDFDATLKIYDASNSRWLMQARSDTSTNPNGIFIRSGNSNSNYTLYACGTDETKSHLIVRGDGILGVNTKAGDFSQTNGASDFQAGSPKIGVHGSIGIMNTSSTTTDYSQLAFYRRTKDEVQGDGSHRITSTHNMGRIAWYGASNDTSFPNWAWMMQTVASGGDWWGGAARTGTLQFHNHDGEMARFSSNGVFTGRSLRNVATASGMSAWANTGQWKVLLDLAGYPSDALYICDAAMQYSAAYTATFWVYKTSNGTYQVVHDQDSLCHWRINGSQLELQQNSGVDQTETFGHQKIFMSFGMARALG